MPNGALCTHTFPSPLSPHFSVFVARLLEGHPRQQLPLPPAASPPPPPPLPVSVAAQQRTGLRGNVTWLSSPEPAAAAHPRCCATASACAQAPARWSFVRTSSAPSDGASALSKAIFSAIIAENGSSSEGTLLLPGVVSYQGIAILRVIWPFLFFLKRPKKYYSLLQRCLLLVSSCAVDPWPWWS